MAASSGGLLTEPSLRLMLGPPLVHDQFTSIQLTNKEGTRIVWRMTSSNKRKIQISQWLGCLNPEEQTAIDITFLAQKALRIPGNEETIQRAERITIEWMELTESEGNNLEEARKLLYAATANHIRGKTLEVCNLY